jgi:LacI family transcriptional regulator
VEDQDVASALLCIRSSQGRGVSVEEIVDRSALPRRTLELRFRKETGRSILEEIQHARLSHAKQLLATSNHSIAAIAELSGYSSTSYLSQVFRKAFACTPAGFRKSARNIQLASSQ